MVELYWTEVDGVKTVWTDVDGPFRASLVFRTGYVFETLTTSGHTHLVEHLALSAMPPDPARYNGWVAGVYSGFSGVGRPEDVSAFLAGVCNGLRSLPADRLDTEKQVIEAEEAGKSYNAVANALMWRYGASGYGMGSFPSLARYSATIEQLQALATSAFTAQNALLWLTGPPPAGLRLPLPRGVERQPPTLAPILSGFPGWYLDNGCGGVLAAATVPRGAASMLYRSLAAARLTATLRTDRGVSYAPSVLYEPLAADTAHLVLWADSEREHRRELSAVFGEFFEGLSVISDAEVEAARADIIDHLVGPLAPSESERPLIALQRVALEWALGSEYVESEELAEVARSVTGSDLMAFSRHVYESATFAVPGQAQVRPWMGRKLPLSTGKPVEGQKTARHDSPAHPEVLVHGAEGVSTVWPDGSHRTARYDSLAGAIHYTDGAVVLYSAEGTAVDIEPTLWRDGARFAREILGAVPPHLLLDQGDRPSTSIPMPDTSPPPQPAAAAGQPPSKSARRTGNVLIALGVAGLLGSLVVCAPFAYLVGEGETDAVVWATAALIVLVPLTVAGVLLFLGIRLVRRNRVG